MSSIYLTKFRIHTVAEVKNKRCCSDDSPVCGINRQNDKASDRLVNILFDLTDNNTTATYQICAPLGILIRNET